MERQPDDFRLWWYWSEHHPEGQRFSAWAAALCKMLIRTECRQLGGEVFHALMYLRVMEKLCFGWGGFDAVEFVRTDRLVADEGSDDFFLIVNIAGKAVCTLKGCDTELKPGDAFLLSCSEPFKFLRPTPGKMLAVRMENAVLSPLVRDVYDSPGRRIPASAEGLRLLTAYTHLLDSDVPVTTLAEREAVTAHVRDLVALALGGLHDDPELIRTAGVQAARLAAAKAFIDRNLQNSDLALAEVAAHVGISARGLQRMFEGEGTTFSEFLLARRLMHVYVSLDGKRILSRSITEIALETGFNDISHFNRAFRRRYQARPSDIRNKSEFRGV